MTELAQSSRVESYFLSPRRSLPRAFLAITAGLRLRHSEREWMQSSIQRSIGQELGWLRMWRKLCLAELAHSILKAAQWVATGKTLWTGAFPLAVIISVISGGVCLEVCHHSLLIGNLEFSGIKKPKLI